MAYSKPLLLGRMEQTLAARPRMPMLEIAGRLGVDRHTLQRALRSARVDFKRLQYAATLAGLRKLSRGPEPCSIKTAANALGFPSADALSHFLARMRLKWSDLRPDVVLTSSKPGRK